MTERRTRKSIRAAAPLLAAAALLGACGVVPGVSGGSEGPIVVMTWAPEDTRATNMPGMLAMAQVLQKYVNDQGGLNGRKLRVLTCNEGNLPAALAGCERRAEKAKAVAVVGSYSEQGSIFVAELTAAGIPYIGGYGITQKEFQSPMSYPVNGGLPALLAGSGRQLADVCRKVTLVRPDTITGDQFPIFLDQGLAAGRRAPAKDMPTADDVSDYTVPAARSVGDNKSTSCVSAVLGDHTSTFFDALRRTGDSKPEVRVSSVLGSVQQSLVDSTGGAASPLEGAYVTGWYPATADPKWNPMKAAITKYAFGDNRIEASDPGVQTTWIAYDVFAKVVRAMDHGTKVDAASVRLAMDRTTGLSTGGLTPTLGWSLDDTPNVPSQPRMVNSSITYQVVKNGTLVQARPGFVNVAATLRDTKD
jgi:hypothetical protein